jgi:hypothetical protein
VIQHRKVKPHHGMMRKKQKRKVQGREVKERRERRVKKRTNLQRERHPLNQLCKLQKLDNQRKSKSLKTRIISRMTKNKKIRRLIIFKKLQLQFLNRKSRSKLNQVRKIKERKLRRERRVRMMRIRKRVPRGNWNTK